MTSWCGQPLLTVTGGERLPQKLGPVTAPTSAPSQSVLPQRAPQQDPAIDSFTTIVVTDNCANGYLVSVEPANSVRLIGIAYDTSHHGITAIVLGHIHTSRQAAAPPVHIRAYSGDHEIGEVVAIF
ncbi:MAG: hypothetical protein M3Y77_05790 [Actinomycetota bacterium]|nr:hypothetical protein [Actinomycetota bacterium]